MGWVWLAILLVAGVPAQATDNEQTAVQIRAMFASGEADFGSDYVNSRTDSIRAYYESRDFKPVWTRDTGPKSKGRALLGELKRSVAHGLKPQWYNSGEIESMLDSTRPADLARLDLLMSGAAIEFGNDLRNGRLGPGHAGSGNAVAPILIEPVRFIADAADAGNYTDLASNYLKGDKRYVRMIGKLAEIDRIAAAGQWPKIDASQPIEAQREAVARLLFLEGDLAVAKPETLSLDELEAGVRNFQFRHGLPPSGRLESETLAEMALPLKARATRVKVNLERRRWQNRPEEAENIYLSLTDDTVRLQSSEGEPGFAKVLNGPTLREIPSLYGTVTQVNKRDGDTGFTVSPDEATSDAKSLAPFAVELEGDWPVSVGMQVYLAYITTWITRDGKLNNRPDRLGRNEAVAKLLQLD